MPNRHHSLTIALHWLTSIVIALSVISVLSRELFEESDFDKTLMSFHRSIGIIILGLTVIRLLSRFIVGAGNVDNGLDPKQKLFAKLGHLALYACLFVIPLLGWAMSNAHGHSVTVFGLFTLPDLVARDRDLSDTLGELHETFAWILIALAGAHAAIALWHHHIKKDQVLVSMLPKRR